MASAMYVQVIRLIILPTITFTLIDEKLELRVYFNFHPRAGFVFVDYLNKRKRYGC